MFASGEAGSAATTSIFKPVVLDVTIPVVLGIEGLLAIYAKEELFDSIIKMILIIL